MRFAAAQEAVPAAKSKMNRRLTYKAADSELLSADRAREVAELVLRLSRTALSDSRSQV